MPFGPIVYMLVGLPYSGKSTFTNSILENENREDWVIVSSDKWIEHKAVLEGISYGDAFKLYVDEAQTKMKEEASQAAAQRKNVIWDQTNLTPKVRKWKLGFFGVEYYKIGVVFPHISDDELLRRRGLRPDKNIPDFVLRQMLSTFVYPEKSEGFDEIREFGVTGTRKVA